MKRVATIILNRNLPEVSDKLYEKLDQNDGQYTDIYIVESGSSKENLSKYATWHADWEEAINNGLRYHRGMNYGLLNLFNEGKYKKYDAFFLLTNDTELEDKPVINELLEILDNHPRVGLLSPCSKKWGERLLFKENDILYFSFIHNNAYFIRREFIDDVREKHEPNYMNFLFDGTNFRGYGSESEIIAKGYINDWASAITNKVFAEENESYLIEQRDLIKTETYEQNLKLYIEEGSRWMHSKYGFKSKWSMHLYVKLFYDQFFVYHPYLIKYKL
jgi:GT2 family glycosyltransferase